MSKAQGAGRESGSLELDTRKNASETPVRLGSVTHDNGAQLALITEVCIFVDQ